MLNFDAERFLERHRVGQVENVRRAMVPGLVAPKGSAVKWPVLHAETPAVAELILRARAVQPRLMLAVNEEEIVALAIPAGQFRSITQGNSCRYIGR